MVSFYKVAVRQLAKMKSGAGAEKEIEGCLDPPEVSLPAPAHT